MKVRQSTGTISISQNSGSIAFRQNSGTLSTKITFDGGTAFIYSLDFSKSKNSMYIPLIFH